MSAINHRFTSLSVGELKIALKKGRVSEDTPLHDGGDFHESGIMVGVNKMTPAGPVGRYVGVTDKGSLHPVSGKKASKVWANRYPNSEATTVGEVLDNWK